jgi:hypothetical protein
MFHRDALEDYESEIARKEYRNQSEIAWRGGVECERDKRGKRYYLEWSRNIYIVV